MIRLIVNADDYGRTPGVSAGIRKAHLEGIVTTTTVMINLPGALDEVHRAIDECPHLGIGVHLNLTLGHPCAPPEEVPSLLDSQGQFLDNNILFRSIDRIDPDHIEVEWREQIKKYLSTGAILDHLDSEMRVAALSPAIWEIFLNLASSFTCGVRPPYPSDVTEWAITDTFPAEARSFARNEAIERLRSSGLFHPDHFFASFIKTGATLEHLLTILREIPPGVSEIMCHPGYVDDELLVSGGYTKERETELSILTNPQVIKAINQAEICLCTYRSALDSAV